MHQGGGHGKGIGIRDRVSGTQQSGMHDQVIRHGDGSYLAPEILQNPFPKGEIFGFYTEGEYLAQAHQAYFQLAFSASR
jgi:hypothetical protein